MNDNEISSLLPNFLINSDSYYLIVTDLKGDYSYVNTKFKNRFSFISRDFIGTPCIDSIYHEDHIVCRKAVEDCFKNPNAVVKVTLRKNDTSIDDFYWTSWDFSLLKNKNNEPLGILCIGHDISESEKFSIEAKRLAIKVENIIEEIFDGFYQIDQNGLFTRINRRAEEILGLKRADVKGKSINEIIQNSDCFDFIDKLNEARIENKTITFDKYNATRERWYNITIYPSVEGLSVFIKDITQEKNNQIELINSENKLKAILDSTEDSNILISPDEKIINFNKVANYIFNKFEHKSLEIGTPVRQYLSEQSIILFEMYFPKALAGKTSVVEVKIENEYTTKWYEKTYIPVYDSSDNLIGVTINTKDITDKKNGEFKIREQEFMMHAIYQSTSEASSFIDKNRIIKYNNPVAREIAKKSCGQEAQLNNDFLDYILPEYKNSVNSMFLEALKGNRSTCELKINDSYWQMTFYPVYDEALEIIGVAQNIQDITNRKQKEETIIKQNEALRAISSQQSHELRRPVANILGLCDLMKNYKNESEETKDKYVDYLLESAKELDAVIHKIVRKANENEFSEKE